MSLKSTLLFAAIATGLFILESCTPKSENRFVEIGGKKQNIRDIGRGTPIVVFVTGLGVDLTNYDSLQNEISKITRTLSYDRAGIGKSEYISNERSIDNLVAELNEILVKEEVNEPIVLVGHSLGGLIIRSFSKKYPEKVIGLFFIDPASEHYDRKIKAIKTEKELKASDSTQEKWMTDPNTPAAIRNEFQNFLTTDIEQMKGISIPSTIPVTILTSTRFSEIERKDGIKEEEIAIWVDLHKEWIKDAPQIRHVMTEKSGHFIHIDEPDLVVRELTLLIDKAKSN